MTPLSDVEAAPRPHRHRIFLGIPMAINARDVLRSGVLDGLVDAGVEVHVFSPAGDEPDFRAEFERPGVEVHRLLPHRGGLFSLVELATMKVHALVQSLRCETLEIRLRGTLRRNPVARFARWALGVAGRNTQDRLLRLAGGLLVRLSSRSYDRVFADHPPDLVLGTRVLTMTPPSRSEGSRALDRHLLIAAARRGVPTMVLVASWDNLTTAGFFPVDPHRITVWNETMRAEAEEIHGVDAARVIITGAPQHDVYARRDERATRDAFFGRVGLDPARRLVVYTTQTTGTVPDEPEIATRIADGLEERFGDDVQLLIRLHQLDRMARYDHLSGRSAVALDQAGRPRPGFDDRDFGAAGLAELADTLHHADVVVNTASSIAIDATACGTPVACVRFDAEPNRTYARSTRRLYDFTHLRRIVASGGVEMVDSPAVLLDFVERCLRDQDVNAEGRARLIREQCYRIDGNAAARMAEAIVETLEGLERASVETLAGVTST